MIENTVLLLMDVLVCSLEAQQLAESTKLCVRRLQAYPVLFEAVLGAKVAILNAYTKAFGALQSAGIVLAIGAEAFPLCRRLLSHAVAGSALCEGQRWGRFQVRTREMRRVWFF